MGLATELFRANRWSIVSLDPEVVITLTGDMPPEQGMDVEKRPQVALASSPGSASPTVQWVAGGALVHRFRGVLRARTMLDDIEPARAALEACRNRDATLGRAPRVTVTWGVLTVTGFVTGLTGRIDGYWATGHPRLYAFDLEVTEAPQVSLSISSPRAGETQYIVLTSGETFELLGWRYLRDPLKGELVRRENPELGEEREAAGDRVKVLEPEHPRMRVRVRPLAPCFQDRTDSGDTWQPLIDELAELRGTANSPGLSWARLTEVISGEIDEEIGDAGA